MWALFIYLFCENKHYPRLKEVKMSVFHPRCCGFEPYIHMVMTLIQDTSTDWFQEADSKVTDLSCENLFHNQAKIDICMFKLRRSLSCYEYFYESWHFMLEVSIGLNP